MLFPPPTLQVGFALKLQALRTSALQEALMIVIGRLSIADVDKELAEFAPREGLSRLASAGLRGELLFATPIVLTAAPRLLGYYRLLLGYSQKDFYTGPQRFGAGPFRGMEVNGKISAKVAPNLPDLCGALCRAGGELLDGLSELKMTAAFLADLSLLTLGPQYRGGANNAVGSSGVAEVRDLMLEILGQAKPTSPQNLVTLKNAAGRTVLIEFGADPDVTIRQLLPSGQFQLQLAIEIKAGRDASNLYNRLGEAEKSHNTARANGYTQCWTIVNVDGYDAGVAAEKSPTTDRFYTLSSLLTRSASQYVEFRENLAALVGIADALEN